MQSTNIENRLRTMAHELGHGVFRLRHTFSEKNKFVQDKGSTDNLMDYVDSSPTVLRKYQWDGIREFHFGVNWFEDGSEAELGIDYDFNIDKEFYTEEFDCIDCRKIIKLSMSTTTAKELKIALHNQNKYVLYYFDNERTNNSYHHYFTHAIESMDDYNAKDLASTFYRYYLNSQLVSDIFKKGKKIILIGLMSGASIRNTYESLGENAIYKDYLECAFLNNEEFYHATTILKNGYQSDEGAVKDHKALHGFDSSNNTVSKDEVQTKPEFFKFKAKEQADEIDKYAKSILYEFNWTNSTYNIKIIKKNEKK